MHFRDILQKVPDHWMKTAKTKAQVTPGLSEVI